jgi:hypothetical protein
VETGHNTVVDVSSWLPKWSCAQPITGSERPPRIDYYDNSTSKQLIDHKSLSLGTLDINYSCHKDPKICVGMDGVLVGGELNNAF